MRTLVSRRALSTVAVVTAALTLTACGGSPDSGDSTAAISLQNCGRTVTLDGPAQRAVTLNQGATESALAMGAQEQMVGTAYLDDTIAPQWQDAYAQVPVLNESGYPSREAVLETKPDLVLASYATAFDEKAAGSQDSLADLGIASYVSPFACADKSQRAPVSWESVQNEIADYGRMFHSGDAARKNTELRSILEEIRWNKAGNGKSVFWYDSKTDTPYVGGNAGGPQLIIDAVGATNVFADLNGAWGAGSWETVLRADPDVIVLVDASWDTAESKKQFLKNDPALRDLAAVRDDAFVVIPFSEGTPGPRLIDGARSVAEQLGGIRK
ncbi:ABC transporter substrate-binding protein [Prescottella sp. R16]|uniref:ABC transporter substrate-binding protein n=1 Tax=Prescottella sp. R16 TaxID=3064529 RepID=UPI00272E30A1|nr:ABC transporter substrate-binding protein [Prescottella sp. R16]